MANPGRFQALQGFDERHGGAPNGSPRAPIDRRRAAVLSYEQLVGGPDFSSMAERPLTLMPSLPVQVEAVPQISAEELVRDPPAHPVAPARPPRAVKVLYEVVAEPIDEVVTEPIHAEAVDTADGMTASVAVKLDPLVIEPVVPAVRASLSPSQRAVLRRPETRLDRNRRATYITYTVDTADTK